MLMSLLKMSIVALGATSFVVQWYHHSFMTNIIVNQIS
jgi:hypothetical protein